MSATGCTIFDNQDYGIKVSPFSNPNLVNNQIKNAKIGIEWESANVFDDFQSTINIEKLVNLEHSNDQIIYDNSKFNIALECPTLNVDSTYQPEYHKGRLNDGITTEVWWNQWSSSLYEPHWVEFNFGEDVNITRFKIFHRSDLITYDYQIRTWDGSSWTTRFNINDNTEHIVYHNLTSTIQASKVKMYITDSNQNLDEIARIREFEIHSDVESGNYLISEPFKLYGDSIFDALLLNKTEPNSSRIQVSVLDGETNNTISGFDGITASNIDLDTIDITKHSSIRIKADFEENNGDKPYLESWKLIYAPMSAQTIEFDSENDIVQSENISTLGGKAQLSPTDLMFDDEWDNGWENNWSITEQKSGGDYQIVSDYWGDGSGDDLFMEGTAGGGWGSNYDGVLYMERYTPNILTSQSIKTRFHGKINSLNYNYADVFIKLLDSGNTSYKQIRWTTRGYSYSTGLSGDTYYIVAQDNDTVDPIEYDVQLDTRIDDLFNTYFTGENQINFTEYNNILFKFITVENYNQKQDPKLWVDYHQLINNTYQYGNFTSRPFTISQGDMWSHLVLNKSVVDGNDVQLSLINTDTGEYINGYTDLTDSYIDISSLNTLMISRISVYVELNLVNDTSPTIDWIKVFSTRRSELNRFSNNEISLLLKDFSFCVYNNEFENSDYGLFILENQSNQKYNDISSSELVFLVSGNVFNNNYCGLKIENTSVKMSNNTFEGNEQSLMIANSSIESTSTKIADNDHVLYFNNSDICLEKMEFEESTFEIIVNNSNIIFDELELKNNNLNEINLDNGSIVTFIDTYHENITKIINDPNSKIIYRWSVELLLKDNESNVFSFTDVEIRNCENTSQGIDNTDYFGYLRDYIVTERVTTSDYSKCFNPFDVFIDSSDYGETIPVFISSPFFKTICPYGDWDDDQIMNTKENTDDTHFLYGSDLVVEEKYLIRDDNHNVIVSNHTDIITDKNFLNVSCGDYKIYLQSQTYPESSKANVTISISINDTAVTSFTHPVDTSLKIYSTPWFSSNAGLLGLNVSISDKSSSDTRLIVYSLVIRKVVENANYFLYNPLNPDWDEDLIKDGYEYNDNILMIDTETIPFSSSQIYFDSTASNRTAIKSLQNGTIINNTVYPYQGINSIYVKARSYGNSGNMSVSINNEATSVFNVDNDWDWYFVQNVTVTSNNVRIAIFDLQNEYIIIDKIMFVKNKDYDQLSGFLMSMHNCENTIPILDEVVTNLRWENTLNVTIDSKPAVFSNYVFYTSDSGYVMKLNRENGQVLKEKQLLNLGSIEYSSTPALDPGNDIGLCYFERSTGLSYIIAFEMSTLNVLYNLTYSSSFDLSRSGLVISNNCVFFTLSGSPTSYLAGIDITNGNDLWPSNVSVTATYLTRPTVFESSQELYFGTNTGLLVQVTDIYQNGFSNQFNVQGGFDLRSVLLPYDNYNSLITISYPGTIIEMDYYGNVLTEYNDYLTGTFDNAKFIVESDILYCIDFGGYLASFDLDNTDYDSSTVTLEPESYIYIDDDKIYGSGSNKIYSFDRDTLGLLEKIQFDKTITDITVCGGEIHLSEKSQGITFCYGPMISDVIDIDLDSDGAKDGKEYNGIHRKILIEAEDYYNNVSTNFNISSATMYAKHTHSNFSRLDLDCNGISLQDHSILTYNVTIDSPGEYSFIMRLLPDIYVYPFYAGGVMSANDAFLTDDEYFILQSLEKAFTVQLNNSAYLKEIGYWGKGKGISSQYDQDSEGLSGGGAYIWEGVYHLNPGSYEFKLEIDLKDPDTQDSPDAYKIYSADNKYGYYLGGMKASFDHFFVRVPQISIMDSDCDDDQVLDGYEDYTRMFPLNSDPDMDGISDYYEINGIPGRKYQYDHTNPICRDTDQDGIRDRIELGFGFEDTDPYTIYDNNLTVSSAFERKIRPWLGSHGKVNNSDSDTSSQTNVTNPDTDNDGLFDGGHDGLIFEPLYSKSGTIGPSGTDTWTTSEEKMNNIIEFWEGEDFDLDGMVNTTGSWTISTIQNQEYLTHSGKESDPENADSDGDIMPDGWEVWHAMDPTDGSGGSGNPNGPDGNADVISKNADTPWEYIEEQMDGHWSSDNINNLDEYYNGTNPARNDTDNDGLDDDEEILDGSVFKHWIWTNIPNASVSAKEYGSTGQYMWYLERPETERGFWLEYEETRVFDYKLYHNSYPIDVSRESKFNVFLTYIYDGSEVVYNTSTQEIYILKTLEILEDSNDNGCLDLTCVVFDRYYGSDPAMADVRYSKIFISDPLIKDSENDGLLDSEENYSYAPFNVKYWGDVDDDYLPNVRDSDSDNDGLLDSREINYYMKYTYDPYGTLVSRRKVKNSDFDDDDFPNMYDFDSDGDKIWDGKESLLNGTDIGFGDMDNDGYPSVGDIDSDNDGIPDGWVDGFRFDPTKTTIYRGAFYYNFTIDGIKDPEEYEDLNGDGVIAGDTNNNRIIDKGETFTETDPYHPDTDRDYLIDGFNVTYIGTIQHHEKYYNLENYGEWNITLNGVNCTNTNPDSDGDTLIDGGEIRGWNVSFETIDLEIKTIRVSSHPLLLNTDGDQYNDTVECEKAYDPNTDDTDRDGFDDWNETNSQHWCDPLDQDYDGDGIPDGQMDLNNNQAIDKYESELCAGTYYWNPDSDHDGLPDGIEVGYLAFRTNANENAGSYDYSNESTWIFLDPGIGYHSTFWYNSTVNNSNINWHTYYNLSYQAPGGNSISVKILEKNSSDHFSFSGSIADRVLIHDGNDYHIFYREEMVFNSLMTTGGYLALRAFTNDNGFSFQNPHPSSKYGEKEIILEISDPDDNNSDGDMIEDGDEYYKLCSGRSILLLMDDDGDSAYPLLDSDSDGDGISDHSDLMANPENLSTEFDQDPTGFISWYYGDPDGDGLPNALDVDSDNDDDDVAGDYSDSGEDFYLDGYHNNTETINGSRNPLVHYNEVDSDWDGIPNHLEDKYGMDNGSSDSDSDGISDLIDGPNGRWWFDLDRDGNVSGNDPDSDNDGLWDGYDIGSHQGELDGQNGFDPTDPWNPDTDNDGLWDGFTTTWNKWNYNTFYAIINGNQHKINRTPLRYGELTFNCDPNCNDSDEDGLFDGFEVYSFAECGIIIDNFHNLRDFDYDDDVNSLEIPIEIPDEYLMGIDISTDSIHSGDDLSFYFDYLNGSSTDTYSIESTTSSKFHFTSIGIFDEMTVISMNWTTNGNDKDIFRKYHLLRKGLNPLSNDSDSDYLFDKDEITGYYGYASHPLSSDSDKDGMKDYEEIFYKYDDGETVENISLNPTDYDIDRDGIPDGYDNDPIIGRNQEWYGQVEPYVLRSTFTADIIYPVAESDGAFSAEGVEDGKLDQSAGEEAVRDFFSEELYHIYDFEDIGEPTVEKKLTYDGPDDGLKYSIKSQRLKFSYYNRDWYKFTDGMKHSQEIIELSPGKDYEISFVFGIPESKFGDDEELVFTPRGEIKIFDDFSSTKGNISDKFFDTPVVFHETYEYNENARIKQIGKTSPYFDEGYRLFTYSTIIPKYLVANGRDEVFDTFGNIIFDEDGKKYLAMDLSIGLISVENKTDWVESIPIEAVVSSMELRSLNETFNIITRTPTGSNLNITPQMIEKCFDEKGIDIFDYEYDSMQLSGTNLSEVIGIDDPYIKLFNFRDSSYYPLDGELEKYRDGSLFDDSDPLLGIIVLADNHNNLTDLIFSKEWSNKWNCTGSDSEKMFDFSSLNVNYYISERKDCHSVFGGLKTEQFTYSPKDAFSYAGKGYSKIKDILEIPTKENGFSMYKDTKISSVHYPSGDFYVISGTKTTYKFDLDNNIVKKTRTEFWYGYQGSKKLNGKIISAEVDVETSTNLDKAFVHVGGVKGFYEKVSYIGDVLTVANGIFTIYGDGKEIIAAYEDGDQIKVILLQYKQGLDTANLIVDVLQMMKSVNFVKNSILFTKTFAGIPLISIIGVGIEIAIFIVEMCLFAWEFHESENFIEARYIFESTVKTAFTALVGIALAVIGLCAFFGPPGWIVGAIIGAVVAIISIGMLILEYSGLLDEYIEFRLNLLGIATSEQTMDALEKVQTVIMDIASAKQTFLYTIESPKSYYELEENWTKEYGTTFYSEFGCNASEYDSSFVCIPLMPHVPGQRGFFKAMWGKDHDNMIVYQAKRSGIL